MPYKQGTSAIAERSQNQLQSTSLKILITMNIITKLFVTNHTVVDNISAASPWSSLFAMLFETKSNVIESGNVTINQFQSTISLSFIETNKAKIAIVIFKIFPISLLLKLNFNVSANIATIGMIGEVTHLQFRSKMCTNFKTVNT